MAAEQLILKQFYRAAGQFVQPDELRRVLSTPQRDIAAEIAQLQRLGYAIESHPHFGFRLTNTPDRLMADDLKARLGAQMIGSEMLVFEETASTNDVIVQLSQTGGREGTVVFAETQTRGRGRRGRTWSSPRGKGLWFSILLRPRFPMPRLTIAASVALARALASICNVETRIKWPNDVMIGDKKVAGILTEARGEVAILGIGLNVNCAADDFPEELRGSVTSLELATGQRHDRPALAVRLLEELEKYHARARDEFDDVSEEWAGLCTTLGKQLVVHMGMRRIEGQAYALDSNGTLILRRDNGQTERILGADVTVEHG